MSVKHRRESALSVKAFRGIVSKRLSWIVLFAVTLFISGAFQTQAEEPADPDLPPEIIAFDADDNGNATWTFYGTVEDEDPESVTVNFEGAFSGSTGCDASGNFELVKVLSPGPFEVVDATAVDGNGAESELQFVILY